MIWLLLISLLVASVFGDTRIINLTDDKPSYNWNPSKAETISVEAEEGYQIEIVILDLNLDGANDNYLTLQNGIEDASDANEIIFTYILNTPLYYFINGNIVLAKYVGTSATNQLSLQFNRKGQALTTTTTQSTSTTEALPSPDSVDRATITVFLYGKAASEFDKSTVGKLKTALANIGQQYCSVQACPLNGTITTNNINVRLLQVCSVMWENYDTCVRLTFGMPVNIQDQYSDQQLWEGYQLNQQHLRIMWDTYAKGYMEDLGLYLYPVPNVETIYKHKLILFSFVIVFFVIIIFIMTYIIRKPAKKRLNEDNDDVAIVSQNGRSSIASLTPHYLQQVPPLFTTDFPLYSEKKNHSDNYGEVNESFTDDFDENEYCIDRKIPETITIVGDLEEMKDSGA